MNFFRTLFFLFFFNSIASANTDFEHLISLAQSKNISNSRAWKKLLHIEPNFIGLRATQVTDKNFFLSNLPEYQNLDELTATLKAFTEPAEKYARVIQHPLKKNPDIKILDHSEHAICRFPARLKYLKTVLSRADLWNQLPKVSCVFQDIFLESLNPKSVSYVFSSYYSDSPGSAFGHTFFRINRQTEFAKERQELLDYGMGFAANVTVTNPAAYALLGLIGGFTGEWTNLPYYYKIREYNDFEARDLWSYDLDLTPDEIQMFALHMWEVGGHSYTYYFFTQNCAYHMLTVLEAAAPRLHLIESVPFYYVIPSDSIKALFFEAGLVKNVSFRSSTRKVFLARVEKLNKETLAEFEKYAKTYTLPKSLLSMNHENKALFLDAAIDLADLRNPQINIETHRSLYDQKEHLLTERAQINYISAPVTVSIKSQQPPHLAHGSSRLGLMYQAKNVRKWGNLQYRFALHDLLDPQFGMPKNSQLEFFNFNFEFLPSELKFQEMNLFKVFNISPINFFENKATWGIELGIQNKLKYCSTDDRDCFLSGLLAKYGRSLNLGNENFVGWGLITANARYGAALVGSKNYFAPGFEIGLLSRLSNDTSILATFAKEYPIDREYNENYLIEIRQSFKKRLGLSAQVNNGASGMSAYYYF